MGTRRMLIYVALPLEAINKACLLVAEQSDALRLTTQAFERE